MSDQYAFNYIYDDYIDTSAPQRAPERAPRKAPQKAPQTQQYQRLGRTRDQLVKAKVRKLKIRLARAVVVAAFVISLFAMAADSFIDYNKSVQGIADANATYHASLEQNNQLKKRLDDYIAQFTIEEIADKLNLQKIPADRKLGVDMS